MWLSSVRLWPTVLPPAGLGRSCSQPGVLQGWGGGRVLRSGSGAALELALGLRLLREPQGQGHPGSVTYLCAASHRPMWGLW